MKKIYSISIIISLVGMLGCAALLYTHKIGADNLWHDEAVTIEYARTPISNILHAVNSSKDLNIYIYFTTMNYITKGILTFSEYPLVTFLRLPFACFGVFSVVAIFLLGSLIYNKLCGFFAALFILTNLNILYFSQEVRPYIIVVFCTAFFIYAVLRLLKSVGKKSLLVFIISATLLPYSHPSVIPVIAGALPLFVIQFIFDFRGWYKYKTPCFWKKWLYIGGAAVVVLIMYIPFIYFSINLGTQSLNSYREPLSLSDSWMFIKNIVTDHLFEMPYCSGVHHLTSVLYALFVMGSIGFLTCIRKNWRFALLTLSMLLCLWYIRIHFGGRVKSRYYIYLIPFYAVYISMGVCMISNVLGKLIDFLWRILSNQFAKPVNRKRVKIVEIIFCMAFAASLVWASYLPIKKYYSYRPNLHPPVRQAVKYMLSGAPVNSIFYGPLKPYDEQSSFWYYFKQMADNNQEKYAYSWLKKNTNNIPNDDRHYLWFISMNLDFSKISIPQSDIEYKCFKHIIVVRTVAPINYKTALQYTKRLYKAELEKVIGTPFNGLVPHKIAKNWYKSCVISAINKIEQVAEKTKRMKLIQSRNPKIILSTHDKTTKFYIYRKPSASTKGSCTYDYSLPIGTTISFDSKGALDLLAITKEITLLPGIYRFEADAKYNDFHDANLHIRSNHRKLPSLQWSGSDKNWTHREVDFVITNSFKTKLLLGFSGTRPQIATAKIRNVKLIWYPDIISTGKQVDLLKPTNSENKSNKNTLSDGSDNFGFIKSKLATWCGSENKSSKTQFKGKNLIDGNFNSGFGKWRLWGYGVTASNSIKIIPDSVFGSAIQIQNPYNKNIGIAQEVNVISGCIYKLSGYARSMKCIDNSIVFGGRIGFYINGQKEKEIVWMHEYNKWWEKDLIFTNQVTGTATLYVHMGYGNVASTGEFTNIQLLKIGEGANRTSKCEQRKSHVKVCGMDKITQKIDFIPLTTQKKQNLISLSDTAKCPEFRIVVYGDSIAQCGWLKDKTWWRLLEKWLARKFPNTQTKLINTAKGGTATPFLLDDIDERVLKHNPNIVIIHTASNEKWSEDYEKRLMKIVNKIVNNKSSNHGLVVLMTPTPYNFPQGQGNNDPRFYNSVVEIAKKTGCGLIDTRYAMEHCGIPIENLVIKDGKHPNVQGQEIIFSAFTNYFIKCKMN